MTDQEIDKWVEEHIKIPPKEEWTSVVYPDLVPAVIKWGKIIAHKFYRIGKVEKDLALSIDDIEKIHTFLYAVKNNKQGAFTFTRLSDEQYKEVLRRFNVIKEDMK